MPRPKGKKIPKADPDGAEDWQTEDGKQYNPHDGNWYTIEP